VTDPPRQRPGLEINEVADGFVVFDPERNRVHYLNQTASLVLEFCDGERTEDDIARMLKQCYELPQAPVQEVRTCLEQLRSEALIS
jgi:hypothetical protein